MLVYHIPKSWTDKPLARLKTGAPKHGGLVQRMFRNACLFGDCLGCRRSKIRVVWETGTEELDFVAVFFSLKKSASRRCISGLTMQLEKTVRNV